MKYLIGSKEEFLKFLSEVTKKDEIAILTHVDLDGIASAIFLEKILNTKGFKVELIEFLTYKKDELKKIIQKLKENKISKIFILDLNADAFDYGGFEELRKNYQVFLIDHHPTDPKLKDLKNIIKTNSYDCVTLVIYNFAKEFFKFDDWNWLVCSAMLSDFSYKNSENLKFIRGIYSDVREEEPIESSIGETTKKLVSSLIYYSDNLKKAYKIIKEKNLTRLDKCENIIKKEIEKFSKKFWDEAEYNKKKDLYFYFFKPKYKIASTLSTIISNKNPDSVIILVSEEIEEGYLKLSLRNQSKRMDMNELVRKGAEGLENATGSGHSQASGGTILKKDLEKFREKVLNG